MRVYRILSSVLALAALGLVATTSQATVLTCPDPITGYQRQATLGPADDCAFGTGNPQAADITANFGGTWTLYDDLTASGSGTYLTISLTSGTFGSGDAAGTWSLDSSYWQSFGAAVIAFHVGQGGGDPDYFSFLITPGSTSGTWTYDIVSGTGGGLSNFRLFAGDPCEPGSPNCKPPHDVPEPGTLGLLGFGLAGLGFGLRRRRKI